MANNTKILLYDLEEDLRKLIESLMAFQGASTTIQERLTNLGPSDFTNELEAIIDDLVIEYQNTSVLTITKINNIRDSLLARIEAIEGKSPASLSPQFEEFTYDIDQDVEKVTVYEDSTKVKKLHETVYTYGIVNGQKEITQSVLTIYTADGTIKEIATQVFAYDENNNVATITTTVV